MKKQYYTSKNGQKIEIGSYKEQSRKVPVVVNKKAEFVSNLKSIPRNASKSYIKTIRKVKGVKPSGFKENPRSEFRKSFRSDLYD